MEAKTTNRYNVPDSQWNQLDNDQQSLYNRTVSQLITERETYLKGINLTNCRQQVEQAFDRIVQGVTLAAIQQLQQHHA